MGKKACPLICTLILAFLFRLSSFCLASQLPMVTYTDDQGLPSTVILSIMQDRDGFIWLGSYTGVFRFDGQFFENISKGLKDELIGVESIFQDDAGDFWLGSYGDIFKYSGRQWLRYDQGNGLNKSTIRSVIQDRRKRILVLTTNDLFIVQDSLWEKVTVTGRRETELFSRAAMDSSGNIWISSTEGVIRYDGKGFDRLGLSHRTNAIFVDSKGQVWIGKKDGAFCFDGIELKNINLHFELDSANVSSICEDREKRIWFGTDRGIYILDEGRTRHLGFKDGLPDEYIHQIFRDRSDNMWVSTEVGLTKIFPSPFTIYSSFDGLPNDQFLPFMEDLEGKLWIGSLRNGVFCFDGKSWRQFGDDRMKHLSISSFLRDSREGLWFGTNNKGVYYCFKGQTHNYLFSPNLISNMIKCFFEDARGVIWIGTLNGMYRYDSTKSNRPSDTCELSGMQIYAITEDKRGRMWVGTFGGGAYYRENEEWHSASDGDGLPGKYILQIFRDSRDRLWFGTAGTGVSVLDGTNFTNFGEQDGLASSTCYSIIEDNGKMYFGTNLGISEFDGENFRNYTKMDGLVSNYLHRYCCRDSRGYLWFGTTRGLTRFDPRYRYSIEAPFKVRILETISLKNNNQIALHDTLDYWENDVVISYTVCDFVDPQNITFRYVLEGYEKQPFTTKSRRIRFTNLDPGTYRFNIWAVNQRGKTSPVPEIMAFTIRSPFWGTLWFRAVMWSSLGAMLFLIAVLWRNKHQAKVLSEKNRELNEAVLLLRQAIESRRTSEKKLIEDTKIDTLSRLSHCVGKDFQKIMNDLIGNTLMLKLIGPDEPDLKEKTVCEIENNLYRTREITRQLEALTICSMPLTGSLSVGTLLKETIGSAVLGAEKIRLKYDIDDKLPHVKLDAALFAQAIQNIVINAIQVMPEGGTLAVSAEKIDSGWAEESGDSGGKYLRICFGYTVNGFTQNVSEKSLEPFSTARPESFELRLSTAINIIESFDGRVSVESAEGQGMKVGILLPVVPEFKIWPKESSEAVPRIMVVGKACADINIFVLMLEMMEYDTVMVNSCQKAVQMIKQSLKIKRFKAVMIDLDNNSESLAEGCFAELLHTNPQIITIAISENQSALESFNRFFPGCKGIITKPFTIQNIKSTLKILNDVGV